MIITDNGKKTVDISAVMERELMFSDFTRTSLHRQLDIALDQFYMEAYCRGIEIPNKWMEENRYGGQI